MRLQPSEAAYFVHSAVSGWMAAWFSVTFAYCVETAKDTTIVAMECE